MSNRTALASWITAAVLAIAVLAAPGAQAVLLYSVDVGNDRLMLLDSVTGAVTDIGPLGDNALDIDLALTSDGRLWGLNAEFGSRVDIWEIDKATGAITSSFQVFNGATAVKSAEGLGAQGNQLKIAFDPVGGSSSSTLGNLSATGVVSGTVASILDKDGLANGKANPFGLYAVDRAPAIDTRLYGINPATNTSTLIGVYSAALGFHDLVTLPGEAIVIDTFNDELYRIDIVTGAVLGTPTTLLNDLEYNGLALADPVAAVPSLGEFGLSLLVFSLLWIGRRPSVESSVPGSRQPADGWGILGPEVF